VGVKVAVAAYLAGLLDSEGTLGVKVSRRTDASYKFGYVIEPYIHFTQGKRREHFVRGVQSITGMGTIREHTRKVRRTFVHKHLDTKLEAWVYLLIGREREVLTLIRAIKPYLIFKARQAELIEQILKKKMRGEHCSLEGFLECLDLAYECRMQSTFLTRMTWTTKERFDKIRLEAKENWEKWLHRIPKPPKDGRKYREEGYRCRVCGAVFHDPGGLGGHVKNVHRRL